MKKIFTLLTAILLSASMGWALEWSWSSSEFVTATYDAAMPSIAGNLPTKTGASFQGYFSSTNGAGTKYYNADGTSARTWNIDTNPTTLYAYWLNEGEITATASPEAGGSVIVTPGGVQPGGTVVTLTPSANSGYKFSQWSDSNTDNPRTVTVNGNGSYTANFVAKVNRVDAFYYSDVQTNIGAVAMSAGTGWRVHVGRVSGDYYKQSIHIDFLLENTQNVTNGYYKYGTSTATAPYPRAYTAGTNTINSSNYGKWCINATSSNNKRWAAYYTAEGDELFIESGTIIVSQGKDSNYPYIRIVDAVLSDGSTLNCTIGQPGAPDAADHFTWSMIYGISNVGSNGNYWLNSYTWWDNNSTYLRLYFYYDNVTSPIKYYCTTTSDNVSGEYYMPAKGVYTIRTSLNNMTVTGNGTMVSSTDRASFITYDGLATAYRLTTNSYCNTVTVSEGADGPFIQISDQASWNKSGKNYGNDGVCVGNPATYYSPKFEVNSEIMGSVSTTYVSGYVYGNSRDQEYKANSIYTAEATPNTGYHFVSWSDGGAQSHNVTITGNTTYTANFAANTYNVRFNANGGSGIMSLQSHTYNSSKALTLNAFTRSNFTFVGWATSAERANNGIVDYTDGRYVSNLTASNGTTVDLYAVWEENAASTYTVTWKSEDGNTTLETDADIASGSSASFDGTNPSKTSDAEWDYTFDGWSSTVGGNKSVNKGASVTVTQDQDYFAYFSKEKRYYNITFKNADGTTLKKLDGTTNAVYSVAYGATPSYDGATPTQAATAQYTYTFNGWDKTIVAVTGETTYTATYSSTTNKYAIRFLNYDGTVLQNTDVAYGETPSYSGTPTKTATGYTYTFTGWNPTISSVAGVQDYTATFSETPNTNTAYTVKHYQQNIDCSTYPASPFETENLSGTTATNVTPATKSYTGFTAPSTQTVSILADGSRVVEYYYTRNKYTVSVVSNNAEYGTVSQASVANVPYGTVITTSTNTINVNGTTVTASATDATAQYTYAFSDWENGTATVNGALTVTANFTRTVNTYTVTWKNGETILETDENVSYGATPSYDGATPTKDATAEYTYTHNGWTPDIASVTGDATYTATFTQTPQSYTLTWSTDGDELTGTYTSGTVTYGTAIAAPNTPTKTGYTFNAWSPAFTGTMPAANTTYTATWTFDAFDLLDDKTDDDDYYDVLASKVGQTLNVRYKRTFPAGEWAVISLPFGYSYRNNEANQTFRGQVYTLVSAKYTSDGYLTLNCMPATTGIAANRPYIVIPTETIADPVFMNVKMTAITPVVCTVKNTEGIGTGVEFRNTVNRVTLEKDKRVIYIKNNTLYYPHPTLDTWIRPFRGYFYLNITDGQIQYSPARIRLVTEEGENIETLPEAEEETSVETKKYIENGILVIERAGIKYDAQGHKLN